MIWSGEEGAGSVAWGEATFMRVRYEAFRLTGAKGLDVSGEGTRLTDAMVIFEVRLLFVRQLCGSGDVLMSRPRERIKDASRSSRERAICGDEERAHPRLHPFLR